MADAGTTLWEAVAAASTIAVGTRKSSDGWAAIKAEISLGERARMTVPMERSEGSPHSESRRAKVGRRVCKVSN